jgi:hypothetical protein
MDVPRSSWLNTQDYLSKVAEILQAKMSAWFLVHDTSLTLNKDKIHSFIQSHLSMITIYWTFHK